MTSAGEPEIASPTMPDPRVLLILDTIFQHMKTAQTDRDTLTDWLLDSQPHTASLEFGVLLDYIATQQPDLLKQLKGNWRVKETLASVRASASGS